MQQQQPRRASDATVVPSKTDRLEPSQILASEPVELDLEQLAHVSGGDDAPPPLPKRFW